MSSRTAIFVVVAAALAACSGGSTAATSPTTSSTTPPSTTPRVVTTTTPSTTPAVPVMTITSWKVNDEVPSAPAAPPAVYCLSPDPPAPCNRLDGTIDLGAYGTPDLHVSVHLSPLLHSVSQFATNVAASPVCGQPCRPVPTTAAGRPAWIVMGSNRGGAFTFLVTRLSDTAYASALHWCGDSCGTFPLAHARRLMAHLVPTQITVSLMRWLGSRNGQYRTLRVPFGNRACDVKTRFTDPSDYYSIGDQALLTTPIAELVPLCETKQNP